MPEYVPIQVHRAHVCLCVYMSLYVEIRVKVYVMLLMCIHAYNIQSFKLVTRQKTKANK